MYENPGEVTAPLAPAADAHARASYFYVYASQFNYVFVLAQIFWTKVWFYYCRFRKEAPDWET